MNYTFKKNKMQKKLWDAFSEFVNSVMEEHYPLETSPEEVDRDKLFYLIRNRIHNYVARVHAKIDHHSFLTGMTSNEDAESAIEFISEMDYTDIHSWWKGLNGEDNNGALFFEYNKQYIEAKAYNEFNNTRCVILRDNINNCFVSLTHANTKRLDQATEFTMINNDPLSTNRVTDNVSRKLNRKAEEFRAFINIRQPDRYALTLNVNEMS